MTKKTQKVKGFICPHCKADEMYVARSGKKMISPLLRPFVRCTQCERCLNFWFSFLLLPRLPLFKRNPFTSL